MMTRNQVQSLRSRLEPFLDAISDEIGYKLTLGNCRFGEVATFKLEAAPIDKDGQAVDSKEMDFKKRAKMFGLNPEDFGKSFHFKDRTFTICGLSPRNTGKYPVLAKTPSGKVYKFSRLFIQSELARKKATNG